MMKWGRRKPPSSSPSRNSSISSVFPVSWLSRFKKMSGSSEHRPAKAKEKARPKMVSEALPTPVSWKAARFYGGDDDSYWRLSFEDDRVEREKIRGGLQSVWYESEDELESPLSSRQDCKLVPGQEETWEFNNKVSGIRELPVNEEIPPRISTSHEAEKEVEIEEFKVLRRKAVEDQNWRKTNGKVLEEEEAELERPSDRAEQMHRVVAEKDVFEASGSGKACHVSSVNSRNFNLNTIEEDGLLEALNLEEIDELPKEKPSSQWEKLKDLKIKELMSKSEKRKSVYVSRELQRRTKQSGKVRVYSPRTAARIECKIKALEDMKKARMKMKRKAKDKAVEARTGFNSFAVVKSSFDPQQDFRNSMIEMITEKGIRRAEELEELLACYLTLNADEYHDLIIRVFRQVWFELKLEYSGLLVPSSFSSPPEHHSISP